MRKVQNDPSYQELLEELVDRYSGQLSYPELLASHRKWKALGKLAKAGLIGMKY